MNDQNGNGDSHTAAQRNRTAVLVVAMHRSGTSALTRTLNLLGCDAAINPMPADEFNTSGYWESRPIYELNEKLLTSGGASWADWLEFSPNWFRSAAMERFRERAIACVDDEFGKSNLFVIKDPRFCLLLPFWRSVFDVMGIEPVVIHTLRNPIEVARSLERRNTFLMSKGILLWLRYTLEGERGSRGLRRYFTTYDDLMNDYVGFIERSQKALNLFWPRNSEKLRRELRGFLKSSLRHHREDARSIRSLDYAAEWVRTTFETLKDFADRGENAAGLASLDAVRVEFTAASHALGSIAKDNDELSTQLAEQQKDREEIETRMAEIAGQQAETEREQEELRELNAKLVSERSALTQERDQLAERALALEHQLADAGRQQEEVEGQAAEAQERADSIQRAKTSLEERHLATQKERDKLREQVVVLDAEKVALQAELVASEVNVGNLQRALSASDAALEARDHDLAKRSRGLADAERLVHRWKAEAGRLTEALEQTRNASEVDMAALRHTLAQTESALRQRQLETEDAADALRAAERQIQAERNAREGLKEVFEIDLANARAYGEEQERRRDNAEKATKDRFEELAIIAGELANRENDLAKSELRLIKTVGERDAQFAALSSRLSCKEQVSSRVYEQFLATLERMLSKAILPIPTLTRWITVGRQRRILEQHAGFDPQWYLAAHEDLRLAGVDPHLHYIHHGLSEGRAPNSAMDALRLSFQATEED